MVPVENVLNLQFILEYVKTIHARRGCPSVREMRCVERTADDSGICTKATYEASERATMSAGVVSLDQINKISTLNLVNDSLNL